MPKESIITRIKIPIDIFNKDPKKAIQQRIGASTTIFSYKKSSMITNDSCYIVDVSHSPIIVDKLIMINIKDIKHDEKNNRYLFLYNNQLVQLSMSQITLSKFTSKIPVKIFRTYNNTDDIKYEATIYKQPFTSLMTPLKNNVNIKTDTNNEDIPRDISKQLKIYEQRIKNLPISMKISKLEYIEELPTKTSLNIAYLLDYHKLPDKEITGILYTVADRRYDPYMILYLNDPTETITRANIRSIKSIMTSDYTRYNILKECYTSGEIEIDME